MIYTVKHPIEGPYKPAWRADKAFDEIRRQAGAQIEPALVDLLV